MKLRSSFVLFLVLLALGRWQSIEARCRQEGNTIVCSRDPSHHKEAHPHTEGVSNCNTTDKGTPHETNCHQTSSSTPSLSAMEEPSAPASESSPSLDEPQSSAMSPSVQPGPLSASSVIHHHSIERTQSGHAPAVLVLPTLVKKTNNSEFVKRRMRAAIYSGNFSAVAQAVIESDDIYGLTMGLTFPQEDKERAITRTSQRNKDGDVVAIKGLLSAGLDPKIKRKVVQLMVIAVVSPEGYHLNQSRSLAEALTEILEDDPLLTEVIQANPQTYARRMLLCAGCSPVYSFVCANCWPRKVCRAYYWCPGSQHFNHRTSPSRSQTTPTAKLKPQAKHQERRSRVATGESKPTRSLSSISALSRPLKTPLQPTQRATKTTEQQVWIKQGNKGDES